MDTASLKSFAIKARIDLLKEVAARLDTVLAPGSNARAERPDSIAALERTIARSSRSDIVDRVAYTWFNRIVALRFMDANGYTPIGVVSPEPGKSNGQPLILSDAKRGQFESDVVSAQTQSKVSALLAPGASGSDPQGAAYGLLLEAYSRHWNGVMPFMFEREGDYTELLMPSGLLANDSVRGRVVNTLTPEVCGDVEVIGWLYQFYNSELKDEVFEGFKKNKKAGASEIPAATQLFTPHWIVRYLVENSLGRLWLLNNPSSSLAEKMDYYIPPVESDTEFLRVSTPEELKVIDPAVGSGHMLTYAFDLLYLIYEEEGYAPSDIPSLILMHNLFGIEIDPRAGALAAFALTMKAASRRKLFLKDAVAPQICVLENVTFDTSELDYLWSLTSGFDLARVDLDEFWKSFEHADTFGSLIQPNEVILARLNAVFSEISPSSDLLGNIILNKANLLLEQARYLSQRYLVIVANPPYMGSGNMGQTLQDFVNANYSEGKSDLFAAFIIRITMLGVAKALVGSVTMQSWMFISSYEKLRARLLTTTQFRTLAHLGTNGFDSIGGDVVATTAFVLSLSKANSSPGIFVRLVSGANESEKAALLLSGSERYLAVGEEFLALPGMPIAYWLPDSVKQAFSRGELLRDVAIPRVGMATGENSRWIRQWWEVSFSRIGLGMSRNEAASSGKRWFPYATSGSPTRWYGNVSAVVDWENDGHSLQTTRHKSGRIRAHNFNLDQIFKSGLVWNVVTSGSSSFRFVDDGFLFDASAGLCHSDRALYLLGLLNSSAAAYILNAINPTFNLPPGSLGSLPLPIDPNPEYVEEFAHDAISLARQIWDSSETSWNFAAPLEFFGSRAATSIADTAKVLHEVSRQIVERESRIDDHFAKVYELDNETSGRPSDLISDNDIRATVSALFSYAIGCMFGRYSLDSPGLILADQGCTSKDFLDKIPTPTFMPDDDNVIPIVEGDWFEDDIVAKFRQFLRTAFGDEYFVENLEFVTAALGVKDLREYFLKSFYKEHVQRYKKRPIYWLFSSPKGSFNALVYLHRYNPSTVSTVLNDYLREFVKKLESELQRHERVVASGTGAREVALAQREADRIRKVLIELQDYERELYDLATQQIDIDLDEGVLVNYQKFGTALKDIGLKKSGGDE